MSKDSLGRVETPRRINGDPKRQLQSQVNDIVSLLRGLTGQIERETGVVGEEDVRKIEVFLQTQLNRTMRDIRLLLAKDPSVASSFSFDMELPDLPPAAAPGTTVVRVSHEAPRTGPAPGYDRYGRKIPAFEGRLVGSDEKVPNTTGLAVTPPPKSIASTADDEDIMFIDEA